MVQFTCRSDIAPSDFWLFSYLKHGLGIHPSATSLTKALSKELNSIPSQEYQKTFEEGIERMKLCIEHQRKYVEHLL